MTGTHELAWLDDYQTWTATTAIYPKDNELAYLALGLSDELAEYLERVIFGNGDYQAETKEAGDVLWYCARLLAYCGETLSESKVATEKHMADQEPWVFDDVGVTDFMILQAGQIAGIAKKVLRDGEKPDTKQRIADKVGNILYALDEVQMLPVVVKSNRDKLDSRKDRGVLGGSGDNR